MRTSEQARSQIVRLAADPEASVAQLAEIAGVSIGTVVRWVGRAQSGEPLHDRPRSGRPGESAEVRARLVGAFVSAGRTVVDSTYSNRALAQWLDVSQSTVSRGIRGLEAAVTGPLVVAAEGPVVELVGVEISRPHVRLDFAALAHPVDAPGQLARKRLALLAAFHHWGVVNWVSRPGHLDRQPARPGGSPPAAAADSDGDGPPRTRAGGKSQPSTASRFTLQFTLQTERELHGVAPSPSRIAVADDRATYYLAVVGEQLARCAHIPAQLCEAISHAVSGKSSRLRWSADSSTSAPAVAAENITFDSNVEQLPMAVTVSPVHRVVQALDTEIRDSGLVGGDSIRVGRVMRLSGLSRAEVASAVAWLEDESIVRVQRGGVVLPMVTAVDVLDLYAARRQLGSVILGRLAAADGVDWRGVEDALSNVRRVSTARPERVGGADLEFQARWARLAGLTHTGNAFERISLRLHVFIAMLKMNYASAAARIAFDDTRILTALRAGDAQRAVAAWHDKVDNAVRHMSGTAHNRRFDVTLWRDLIGS